MLNHQISYGMPRCYILTLITHLLCLPGSYDMDAPAINSSQKENRYTFPNQRVSVGEPPMSKSKHLLH